jgi:hypothetical protein
VWTALAHLERIIRDQERYVLAQDDIANAFDNVPVDEVIEIHRHHLEDDKLVGLLEAVVRGNPNRATGIDQGSPVSPLLLNVELHHVLDAPFSQNAANSHWIRYADDLAYATRSVPEGEEALATARDLLQPHGLTLKGEEGPPADLRREDSRVRLLGFIIKWRNNRLHLEVPQEAWRGLDRDLQEAHEAENPPEAARMAAGGWAGAYGPAFEGEWSTAVDRILRAAARAGFRELPRRPLERAVQSASDRWNAREAGAPTGEADDG